MSFFHQRVCVRSKDAAHLLSLLSLPPPACLRSSAAANRPPPSLRSTPLFLLLSLPFSIAKITSHSHSRAVYISSLFLCGSSCSAPPVNSPSSSSASLVNFIRASVHYASLCLLSLSLSFVSSSISSCARNVVGRDFLRRGNLSEFIICRNRRS